MNFPSIRIEGAILSPDILDRIEDAPGQKPADFGLDASSKVKDEIARAWADAQDYWRIFQRKLSQPSHALRPPSSDLRPLTSETRQQWIVPLLGLLGYQLEYQPKGAELNGKLYAISHRAVNRAQTPVHIVGYRDPTGLDRKPENAVLRMSPHAMVQEYLNLHDQLYGIVTNGRVLRLLRDSSRLVKLSYLEFDLDRIFTDGLFADFAILYRLLHATRLPVTNDTAAESLIERYHQDSLDSGARIRDGLSRAVEQAIRDFGNGFLANQKNTALCAAVADGTLTPETYYKHLLNLIYRLLFLMVIEERGLIFPPAATTKQREIYRRYYSVQRLRLLSEKRYLADPRRHDHWLALTATFRLFEAEGPGAKLGLAPLAGDLFGSDAIGLLSQCLLGNDVLLGCLRSLSLYEHPDNRQLIRVNYAALNVEEFGSVYEGLLEYDPVFLIDGARIGFGFKQGDQRAATGSHYTPDELVQPLIKHSLDYLIEEQLKEKDKETALLSLRICDVACGSGHILLNAARRVGIELATVRTGEEQPSPPTLREAVRDVIRHSIYGVDLNPLAVELCKVALWLEAHVPGESLNFLDHHIKCGNAIVGLAHEAELQRGISDEAFNRLPDDDKDVATQFRKRNKVEKEEAGQQKLDLSQTIRQELNPLSREYTLLATLPDHSPTDYRNKKAHFEGLVQRKNIWRLRTLANLQVAQFFIPKTPDNKAFLCTEEEYRDYLNDKRQPQSQAVARANTLAVQKRWFHWFIEFPDIFESGGFDCILGNPPYLGGQRLSGSYGHTFLNWVKTTFDITGSCDLVTYFFRRIFALQRPQGFFALISTNTIAQGVAREGGLEQILEQGGVINFAAPSVRWPGAAAVVVTLITVFKGAWKGEVRLRDALVKRISSFLDDAAAEGEPKLLATNKDKAFMGSTVVGEGFILSPAEAEKLKAADSRNAEVIFPYLDGSDLNSSCDQSPSRRIINFYEWSESKSREYDEPFEIVFNRVKPSREADELSKKAVEKWWQYYRPASDLYESIRPLKKVLAVAQTSKTLAFSFVPTNYVFSMMTIVFAFETYRYFAVLQSNVHNAWAWKYSSTMKSDLRYTPSAIFQNFPFPQMLDSSVESGLEQIGERYHEHRRELMLKLQLGLTKTYNLFHDRELSAELVAKESKQPLSVAASAYADLLQLRALHVQMDEAVLAAYGWHQPSEAEPTISLRHDFYEVDYLPENDRVRYTIHPDARKEILKRLLALNHARAAEEAAVAQSAPTSKPKRPREARSDHQALDLFA
ncbi:MAG: DNA methyltransferase [bacterium]